MGSVSNKHVFLLRIHYFKVQNIRWERAGEGAGERVVNRVVITFFSNS